MTSTNPKTILLVEDESIIALSKKMLLEKQGFLVECAYNGESALEHVRAAKAVDLVLMDIDLGRGMDGTRAAELILQEREVPIIFHTSHGEREMVEKVKGITRYGYVLKNAGEFVLLESIAMAFELFEAHRNLGEREERLRFINELSADYSYCHRLEADGSLDPVWHIGSFDAITGYSPQELYKMGGWAALIHPDDLPGVAAYVQTLLSGQSSSVTARIITKSGEHRWIQDTGRPWFDKDGSTVIGTLGSARDITKRKQVENELRSHAEELSAIYENTPVLMLLLDKQWSIIKANAYAGEFAGSRSQELLGKRCGEVLHCLHSLDDPRGCGFGPHCADCGIRNIVLQTLGEKRNFNQVELPLYRARAGEKEEMWFRVSTAVLPREGENLCLASFEDITAYKGAEKQRREKESLYHNLMENSIDGVYLLSREGRVLDVNRTASSMTGYTREELLGLTIDDLDPNFPSARFIDFWNEKPEGASILFETLHKRKDGTIFPVEVNGIFFLSQGEKNLFGVARDLTERKEREEDLEERETNLRILAESAGAGITVIQDDRLIFVNKTAAALAGIPQKEMLQKPSEEMVRLIHPEDRERVLELLQEQTVRLERLAKDNLALPILEYRHVRPDGSVVWLETLTTGISYNHRPALLVVHHDITEQKKLLKEIRGLLQEKELILKESNHRIKNNLSTIAGLLSLQAAELTHPEAVSALQEALSRVDAITILHEKLLALEGGSRVPVPLYLGELTESILTLYSGPKDIRVEQNLADFSLDSRTIFTLGIIFNEVLTNSLKYAFRGREQGLIRISSDHQGERVSFVLEDNGCGLPEDFVPGKTGGLGTGLVRMLAEQLEGRISFESSGGGTRVSLEFPV